MSFFVAVLKSERKIMHGRYYNIFMHKSVHLDKNSLHLHGKEGNWNK